MLNTASNRYTGGGSNNQFNNVIQAVFCGACTT